MLATLHDSLRNSSRFHRPQFRFFVVSHAGQIRFFLEADTHQKDFLESQLYAHYSDIELHESRLPFDEETEMNVEYSRLSEISQNTIKLYINLDDRTEKEVIDPLSSVSSVLAKTPKNDTAFFRVDFAPIADTSWRTGMAQNIITSSHIPAFFKQFLLSNLSWIRIILFPMLLLGSLVSFLLGRGREEESNKDDERESIKFDTFGYGTRIVMATTSQNASHIKELSSSLHIFSHPKGNRFITKNTSRIPYKNTLSGYNPFVSILSTTELAGLVHMPTMYIKTP